MGLEEIANLSIKYLLIVFNVLFVITGIIITSVGSTVQAKYDGYLPFLDPAYSSVPAFLIAIGVIIFLVAIFGICGAIKGNYCMTLIFSIMLILIFILELAAGISGYVLRNRTESILNKNLLNSIDEYYAKKEPTTRCWDDIQNNFQCCGIDNVTSWDSTGKGIPISCCAIPAGTVGPFECLKNMSYPTGCISGLNAFISSHAGSLGAAGIFIAIAQLFGIIFACYLTRRAKHEASYLS